MIRLKTIRKIIPVIVSIKNEKSLIDWAGVDSGLNMLGIWKELSEKQCVVAKMPASDKVICAAFFNFRFW